MPLWSMYAPLYLHHWHNKSLILKKNRRQTYFWVGWGLEFNRKRHFDIPPRVPWGGLAFRQRYAPIPIHGRTGSPMAIAECESGWNSLTNIAPHLPPLPPHPPITSPNKFCAVPYWGYSAPHPFWIASNWHHASTYLRGRGLQGRMWCWIASF